MYTFSQVGEKTIKKLTTNIAFKRFWGLFVLKNHIPSKSVGKEIYLLYCIPKIVYCNFPTDEPWLLICSFLGRQIVAQTLTI